MLHYLKQQANLTHTENGAATYRSSGSACLDLFAAIGALREAADADVVARFQNAWAENCDLALRTLFFARDIRGGLGERKVFRTVLRHLAHTAPETVTKNLWAVAEFGRYDDLLLLLDSPLRADAAAYIKAQLDADLRALEDGDAVSLLAKWLPSVNAHNADTLRHAKILAKALGMRETEYRRTLTRLRAGIPILENKLRERDYSFAYEAQPSRAIMKYRRAFLRHDGERYRRFLCRVANGESIMHTGTLYPYDIIRPALHNYMTGDMSEAERRSLNVTWNAQEDFTRGENALAVIDGSGSMYGGFGNPLPAEVALSLGVYFAERCKGAFAGHFITFSSEPQLVEIQGKDIFEKIRHCAKFDEVANTNIEAVFALILSTAVQHELPQSELPATLYIISDMEFDECTENAECTNFAAAKSAFAKQGYQLPNIVFWNVDSRSEQQPVAQNEQGAILVSGASPQIFAMVQSGNLTPAAFMLDTLNRERYAKIQA